jgi:hypothetical protein
MLVLRPRFSIATTIHAKMSFNRKAAAMTATAALIS